MKKNTTNKPKKHNKSAINSIQNPVSPNRPFISPMVDPDGSWTWNNCKYTLHFYREKL